MAKIEVTYADGSKHSFSSVEEWQKNAQERSASGKMAWVPTQTVSTFPGGMSESKNATDWLNKFGSDPKKRPSARVRRRDYGDHRPFPSVGRRSSTVALAPKPERAATSAEALTEQYQKLGKGNGKKE